MPELSKEFFEKNGMEAPDKHGRAILELEYRASREQRTLYMDEIDFQNAHFAKLSAFLATTTYMAMMDYNYQYNNPDATTANLDPNVRLDKMELDSLNQGFKTVDYVPLTSESLEAEQRIDGVFDEYYGRVDESKTLSPYDLKITHKLTLSKREMEKLADDIKMNGIQEPVKYIEVNGIKYIVDGHHRVRVAKEIGLTEIPVEEVSFPYQGYDTVNDLFWTD